MSPRGRHASRSNVGRDLAIMAAGVVVVGALVFGLLWAYQAVFGEDEAVIPPVASTTVPTTGDTAATETTGPTATTEAAPDTTATTEGPVVTTSTVTPRDPAEIVVLVLNSVGTDGLAAGVAGQLEDLGYEVLEPDDYEPALDRSQILFRDGYGPEAFELASVVPDAEIAVNPDPAEADIVVLLGSSYDG